MQLDRDTQLALIEEIDRRIPAREQNRVAIAIADKLGTGLKTEGPRLSRLLNKDAAAIDQLLGPETVERVLAAICAELKCSERTLLESARQVARARPSVAPDRHPAWRALGDATPWVEEVPGMQGLQTLKAALEGFQAPEVVWLTGAAGTGKTAWLWRAHREGLGELVTERPAAPDQGAVFLVDEPADPDAWRAWANQWEVRLVIATRREPSDMPRLCKIRLESWSPQQVAAFVRRLRDVPMDLDAALDCADLDAVGERVQLLAGSWTPLAMGHALRLLVDEPALALAQTSEGELRVRHALHQLSTSGAVPPGLARTWSSHGRKAATRAASVAMRRARGGVMAAAVDQAALEAELAPLAGTSIGGRDGEPLSAVLARAKRDGAKKLVARLEEWAAQPSAADLVTLLVESGLWRNDGVNLVVVDVELAVGLAASELEEDWRWGRLLETLADPNWSIVRRSWAAGVGRVEPRVEQLLSTGPAVHVGAIELAAALAAHAPESPRPDQLERIVCSALQILMSIGVERAQLGHRRDGLVADLRLISHRHRRSLPQLAATWDASELARRGTATMAAILRRLEELAVPGEPWLGDEWGLQGPAWATYAAWLPWQARRLLEEPASRTLLLGYRGIWEQVILDHAADGDAWSRAIATGDVDDFADCHGLVNGRTMLDALTRWRGPRDLERHETAIGYVLHAMTYEGHAGDRRFRAQVVEAVAELVRAHPDCELPSVHHLTAYEGVWLDAFVRAKTTRLLVAWFEAGRRELDDSVEAAKHFEQCAASAGFVLPDGHRQLDPERCRRLVRIAGALHQLGATGLLSSLLAKPGRRHGTRTEEIAWMLAVGAAGVLLQAREAGPLRQALAADHGGDEPVREALGGEHDDATLEWIASELDHRYQDILARIPGRRDWRELARRWSRSGDSSGRRYAAAVWLLEHGEADEADCVLWLMTDEPVAVSRFHANRALFHPDERVRAAAARLLKRALEGDPVPPDLHAVARRFDTFDGQRGYALYVLKQYLVAVNQSQQQLNVDSLDGLLTRAQAAAATCTKDEESVIAGIFGAIALAARRARWGRLATWLRAPFGAHGDAVSGDRAARVRHAVAAALLGRDSQREPALDAEVLELLGGWEDPFHSHRAHMCLLELARVGDEQLVAEWNQAGDAVLVGKETASARWYGVQELLRDRAPERYASALASRLLALPPELKRFGISYISQVAMHDPRQAERLSDLFD